MPPMRNIYNLITDAFSGLGYHEHNECDYLVEVKYSDTVLRSYEITIKSRDPNVDGLAFLHLMLNAQDELVDYDDANSLFIDSNWDLFCEVFELQIAQAPVFNLLSVLNYEQDV